jgi:plasmid stability protein
MALGAVGADFRVVSPPQLLDQVHDWGRRFSQANLTKHALLTYTLLMAMTTIRVEAEVRDRLAARAEAHGQSLGAELRAILDEMMWQGIEAGYRRLATHRGTWRRIRRRPPSGHRLASAT